MRQIWYAERPSYEGRFVRFSGVQAYPRPRRVPIVVGGESAAAHRRAVEQGHGWYGFALDLAETAAQLEGLGQAALRYERPADLGELEISVTPPSTPDRETADRYAELGVHRLILRPRRDADEAGLAQFVSGASETLVGSA
jgi:alkanesulfonate monooxygenase SsuD/methylene tetrahydromethanopterin reductase-like flavin-dependent oxidoreductase (luciferase family)